MRKLWPVVLLVWCGAWACASPERKACNRMVELCGGGDSRDEQATKCEQALGKVKKVAPDELPKLATCMQESTTCAAAVGCQAGSALNIGLGAGKSFLDGLGRSLSGDDQKKE